MPWQDCAKSFLVMIVGVEAFPGRHRRAQRVQRRRGRGAALRVPTAALRGGPAGKGGRLAAGAFGLDKGKNPLSKNYSHNKTHRNCGQQIIFGTHVQLPGSFINRQWFEKMCFCALGACTDGARALLGTRDFFRFFPCTGTKGWHCLLPEQQY